ncbi:MAG: hypothetical protein HY951_10630 [Bacteroidia bacterium]|nr:hypothetical protein [Bacteroidia bacterium]
MANKILFFSVFIIVFNFCSNKSFSQDSTKIAKRYFGLSLQPNFQSIITFAIIEISDKGVVTRTFLSRRDWLHQIVGIQQSSANAEGKNLLKDAGIEGPEILDELWKLRYSEPPYDGSPPEKGWAAKPRMASEGQMDMLRQFGIKTINDYFFGENLYKLLNSMEDPGWVADYMNK